MLRTTVAIVAVFPLAALVVGCGPNQPSSQRKHRQPVARSSPVVKNDALTMCQSVFAGNHARDEIKARLDTALQLYGHPLTEENYSRAGSSLVSLRKDIGVQEMDVLDHMIRSHVDGTDYTFPQAAALSAAFLAVGDQ